MAEARSVALLTSGNMGWTDIRDALTSIPGVAIVADVSSVEQLLAVAARERLDAVIMPARVGETSLLPLLLELQPQANQRCQFIILAHQLAPSEVAEALSSGAASLLKWSDLDLRDLPGRLQSVILGGDMIMTASVATSLRDDLSIRLSNRGKRLSLSERELLILQDLAEGLTRKEIAFRRAISLRTASRIIGQLRLRFDVPTTRELLVEATRADTLPRRDVGI